MKFFIIVIAAVVAAMCVSFPSYAQGSGPIKTYPGIEVVGNESPEEKAWIDRAMKCKNISISRVYRSTMLYFLRVEEKYLPSELRGLSLAAACAESGFNPNAMGDYRRWDRSKGVRVKCKKGSKNCYAKAVGVLQFWPWAKKYIDRRDMFSSVEFWAKRVVRQAAVVKRACKYYRYDHIKSGGRVYTVWSAAEAKGVRGPGKKRCREKTTHWKKWKKWRVDVYRSLGAPIPTYRRLEDVEPGCNNLRRRKPPKKRASVHLLF